MPPSSLPPLVVLLYLILLLSIVNGHLTFDAFLSLSLVPFVLPLWLRGLMILWLEAGFRTAGKIDSGQPLPISVSEGDAGSYTSPLCVGAHSDDHVRWGLSV